MNPPGGNARNPILDRLVESHVNAIESINRDLSYFGVMDPRDLGLFDDKNFIPPGGPIGGMQWLDRRRRGEYLPVFLNELQLSLHRRRIRWLVSNNEIALNAANQRVNYAIGTGFEYEVTPREGCPPELVQLTSTILDRFKTENEMGVRETEAQWRSDVEGESFWRLFPQENGILHLRTVEPEHVTSPTGNEDDDNFGIRTSPNDVETVLGYWIKDNGNSQPQFVEAKHVIHIKHAETPSTSKRGLSAYYPIESSLRAAEDLLMSTVSMAKARAKIALIRKLTGTTIDFAKALLSNSATDAVDDPTSGKTFNLEKLPYGSVLTMPDTTDVLMPSANVNSTDHVQVMQMVLRIIASRFGMPEYLLSADASNANYSSTLVAESPFVKGMERLQQQWERVLSANRYPGHRQSLLWRQIRWAVCCGLLPKEVFRLVDIRAVGPSLVVRDIAKEAQVDQIYHLMGVKSIRTIQLEQGLDPDTEAAAMSGPIQQMQPDVTTTDKQPPLPPMSNQ